jgi:hypothetical protein
MLDLHHESPAVEIDQSRIQRSVSTDLRPHFEHIWRTLDRHPRDTLLRIAMELDVEKFEVSQADLLISRGHIQRVNDEYRVSSRLFREFLLEKSGRLPPNSLVIALSCEVDPNSALSGEMGNIVLANQGTVISPVSGFVASFSTPDSGLTACVSIRDLFDREQISAKIAAIVYAQNDGLTKARLLCRKILDALEPGEIASTKESVLGLSRPFARKFRKMPSSRRPADLPSILLMVASKEAQPTSVLFGRPKPGKNNIWYDYSSSDTVFVFVHGIFSDSASCWMNEEASVFWPELVRSDPRLERPAIYLGGYYTGIASDKYDLDNCEYELFTSLKRPQAEPMLPPVLKWERIIFICHSTGGIVARYMLERRYEEFASKHIGLVLVASPSYGSKWADRLSWLARVHRNRLGQQLRWASWNIQDLDSRFKSLLYDRKIPGLVGVEAYENRFIIQRTLLPNLTYVVDEESAGRYFGPPILLRGTDHFSAVKPSDMSHPSQEVLVDFYTGAFRK